MKVQDLFENAYRLKDLCEVATDNPDAHFWVTRRGTAEAVGKPSREFNSEDFGISVFRPDVINADYLYYALDHLHKQGYWKDKTVGTLKLVHIRKRDVENIQIG